MKRKHLKSLVFVGFFIIVTGVAMASLKQDKPSSTVQPPDVGMNTGFVTVSAHLIQDKIFTGGDGTVAISLSMQADDVLTSDEGEEQPDPGRERVLHALRDGVREPRPHAQQGDGEERGAAHEHGPEALLPGDAQGRQPKGDVDRRRQGQSQPAPGQGYIVIR